MPFTRSLTLVLFNALAKKYNHERAIKSPEEYLTYFSFSEKHGYVSGATIADKMTDYFMKFSEDGKRISLMKTIFNKHDLVFSDSAMSLYYQWVKTCPPVGKTNRYIKMNDFTIIHKSLFSA
jgi:hypothetical protein